MDAISSITPPHGNADVEVFRAERADRAYKSFEAMFLQILLKEMRKSVPDEGGIFPKSSAQDTYEEMLDGALSQNMAESGQFGIAKQLAEEAARQEAAAAQSVERHIQRASLEALKPPVTFADKP